MGREPEPPFPLPLYKPLFVENYRSLWAAMTNNHIFHPSIYRPFESLLDIGLPKIALLQPVSESNGFPLSSSVCRFTWLGVDLYFFCLNVAAAQGHFHGYQSFERPDFSLLILRALSVSLVRPWMLSLRIMSRSEVPSVALSIAR